MLRKLIIFLILLGVAVFTFWHFVIRKTNESSYATPEECVEDCLNKEFGSLEECNRFCGVNEVKQKPSIIYDESQMKNLDK